MQIGTANLFIKRIPLFFTATCMQKGKLVLICLHVKSNRFLEAIKACGRLCLLSWFIALQITVTSHAKTYTNSFPFLNGKSFTSHLSAVQKKLHPFKTALLIRSKNLLIRSNGLSHPFRKNLHPFEWLRSPVQKKLATVRTAWKNLAIHSNGLSHPFITYLYLFEWLESSVGPFRKKTNVIRSFARTAQYLFRENHHPFGRLVICSKCQSCFLRIQRQRIYKGALVQIRVPQPVKCRRIPFVFLQATTLWIVRSINILYSITFINLSNL